MNAIEQLKSVLCDPTGKCCIKGSEEDRAIVDRALQTLAQRTWVGLTDDVIVEAFCKAPHQTQYVAWFAAGVRFAEAAHGIKENT
jgi:hypothetical protein